MDLQLSRPPALITGDPTGIGRAAAGGRAGQVRRRSACPEEIAYVLDGALTGGVQP